LEISTRSSTPASGYFLYFSSLSSPRIFFQSSNNAEKALALGPGMGAGVSAGAAGGFSADASWARTAVQNSNAKMALAAITVRFIMGS
jgi:hypothetical protein